MFCFLSEKNMETIKVNGILEEMEAFSRLDRGKTEHIAAFIRLKTPFLYWNFALGEKEKIVLLCLKAKS